MNINNKRLFLFDIDGVIKLGDTLIDGALDLFNYINSINGKSIFITNNSTKSSADYVDFFKKLGFMVDESNFITALTVTTSYLKENHNKDKIFVVGTNSLFDELKQNNLNVVNTYCDDIDVVLVGFDNELNYSKITDACKILQTQKVIYLATNMDLRCPMPFGYIPDCGAIVNFIKEATNKDAKFIGKPAPEMVYYALSKNTKYSKEQTLVIGDRLYTDIACGINAGVDTCVVYTGEATKEDVKTTNFKPTFEYESVKELFENMKK